MSISGFLKRAIVAVVGLVIVFVFALTALYQYIDKSPDAQERLELSAKRAELSISEDDGFLTKLGVLIAVWWNSDELVADAREDKELAEQEQAERRKEAEAARFRDDTADSNDDYYARN